MDNEKSFFWHDYETSGTHKHRDRPMQFAGIRTNLELEPIADPVTVYCQPALDCLPNPQAVLLTGITPQYCLANGIIESAFADIVLDQLGKPGTCGVGYNSLSFDDEVTRCLLYRNFHDPYAREWQNGSSRFDLLPIMRMAYAFYPDALTWPIRDDGGVSFRLEHLAAANNVKQTRAHDALADVEALLGLARLLKQRAPVLWAHGLDLRNKQKVLTTIDSKDWFVLANSFYPQQRRYTTIGASIGHHPTQQNSRIVIDLIADFEVMANLDPQAIRARLFTHADGVERLPITAMAANKLPAIVDAGVLSNAARRASLGYSPDIVAKAIANRDFLRTPAGVDMKARIVAAYAYNDMDTQDTDVAVHGGFASQADKRLLAKIHLSAPVDIDSDHFAFSDSRFRALLPRYRARNWPTSLDPPALAQWHAHCAARLNGADGHLSLDAYKNVLAEAASAGADPVLLQALATWGDTLVAQCTPTLRADAPRTSP